MKLFICIILSASSTAFSIINYKTVGLVTNQYTHWSHNRLNGIEKIIQDGLTKSTISNITSVQKREFGKCISKIIAEKMDELRCNDNRIIQLSAQICNKMHKNTLWLAIAENVKNCIPIVHP